MAPDECMKMNETAAKLQQLSRAHVNGNDDAIQFDISTAGKGAHIDLETGVVHFTEHASVMCTGEFKSGIHRLSFRNLGKSEDDTKIGTQCLWGIGSFFG